MKPNMRNIDEVMKRYLPSASDKQMDDSGVRVLRALHSELDRAGSCATGERTVDSKPSSLPGRRLRLLSLAAGLILVAFVGIVWRNSRFVAVVQSADGSMSRTFEGEVRALHVGESLEPGEIIRSNGGGTFVLSDGSSVEVRSQSEILFEPAGDGLRIRLGKGGVIVNAARQREGRHLYVQTKDVTVAVVGTVFLVNAEEEGSRVAVIEGEVRVKQGATETKLGPGEQVSTNAKMQSLPIKEEIGWSRQAEAHLALLQTVTAAQLPPIGSISGMLRVSGGAPAAGMRVAAMAIPDVPGSTAISLQGMTEANEDGSYRIENIPAGRYYVVAGPLGFPTYYPGAEQPGNATVITVNAGASLGGFDFIAKGVIVSGKILNIPSEWNTLGAVAGLFRPNGAAVPGLRVPLKADGSFRIVGARPGVYCLAIAGLAFAWGGNTWVPYVAVGDTDVTGVTLDLKNNPFPDRLEASHSPVFDFDRKVTLRGVITQPLTQLRPKNPVRYWRMDLDEGGTITSWAVIAFNTDGPQTASYEEDTAKLVPRTQITVTGSVARDGTRRLYLDGEGPILTRLTLGPP